MSVRAARTPKIISCARAEWNRLLPVSTVCCRESLEGYQGLTLDPRHKRNACCVSWLMTIKL